MLLHHASWSEVEQYLLNKKDIIIPIGSTEQHGPSGLIGTDALCAQIFAEGLGDSTGSLVAPTINVGMAIHHMHFPGTISLRPTTLINLIQDHVLSLAHHGFRRFFFVNGHGGNIPTMHAAFYEIYAASEGIFAGAQEKNAPTDPVRCRVTNWYDLKAARTLSATLFAGQEGMHATPSEISVTQHFFPGTIKAATRSQTAASGRFYGPGDYRHKFPDGCVGSNPSLASPDHGKTLYDAVLPELVSLYLDFVNAP